MIFWLVLKIEIIYTVIILKDLHFHMVKQLSFHNSSFALKILFNANGKATV